MQIWFKLSTGDYAEVEAESENAARTKAQGFLTDNGIDASITGTSTVPPTEGKKLFTLSRPSFDSMRDRLDGAHRSGTRKWPYKNRAQQLQHEFETWPDDTRQRVIDWVHDPDRRDEELRDWVNNGGDPTA